MQETSHKSKRVIGVFTLAMINLAAVGGIKNWSVTAEYGFASIFYLLIAAIVFFIPVSLVSAELATGWPKMGGVYVWVKEAFGHRTGFLAIWLQWVQNLAWYPTVLSFIAAALSYVFDPELANNTYYIVIVILVAYWTATFANLKGMRTSGWISSLSVVFGTFIPGALIILLGLIWCFSGNPLQISLSLDSLVPKIQSIDQIVFFTGILLFLCGMEMSAAHAQNVHNPRRNYPKAIIVSAIIIIAMTVLGVLAISIVVPQKEISLVAGSLQAFTHFLEAYHMRWLTPIIAALVAIGAFGSMSTWVVGPTKGLLAAAQQGDLPPAFRKINAQEMPVTLLIGQGVLVSLISLIFLFMPSISSAFWILSAIVAQLYLLMYILMFAAAIKLRYSKPTVERPYRVPGGHVGMWIVSGIGLLSSLFAMAIGFFPPSQIATGSLVFYESFLIIGVVLCCIAPALIGLFQKPSWKKPLKHERNL